MAERTPPRQPSTNWAGHSKTLALWSLFILIVIALFQYTSKKRAPTEFTYS